MTAVLGTDALAPLAALLDRTYPGAYPAGLRVAVPPGAPWRAGGDLADPDRLEAVLTTVMRRYGATRHVAAALLWKTYTYRVVAPVVLGWALNQRAPLATGGHTAVRPGPADSRLSTVLVAPTVAVLAGDPLGGTAGTVTLDTAADVLALAGTALLGNHLRPVLDALSRVGKLGHRPLWGAVAEAAVHPVMISAARVPGPIADAGPEWRLRTAHEILAGLGHGLDELLDFTPTAESADDGAGTPYRRRTCCLAFSQPQYDYCATCCVPAGQRGGVTPPTLRAVPARRAAVAGS